MPGMKPAHCVYSHTPWNAPSRAAMDHRFGRRIACNATVRVTFRDGATGRGRLRNVSISGAFIETKLDLPVHARITIEVVRENGSSDTRHAACVVRTDTDGVGIEWLETAETAICPLLGCTTLCSSAHSFEN